MYAKVINTNKYPQLYDHYNYGNYPYNLPKNGKWAPNTLEYNNEKFNQEPICVSGGLYYCDIENIVEYFVYGNTICIVHPMNDSQVVIVDYGRKYRKYKTDKLWIQRYMKLYDIDTLIFLINNGVNSGDIIYFFVKSGDLTMIKKLYSNIDNSKLEKSRYGIELICFAAQLGYLDILLYIIEKDRNDINDAVKYDAVKYAAKGGHLEIVQHLIEKESACSTNVLSWANNIEIVKYLENYIDEDNKMEEYQNAIEGAVKNGNLEIVVYLVEKESCDLDKAICCCANNDDINILDYLITQGANIHTDNEYLLQMAIITHSIETVKYLVEKGADIYIENGKLFRLAADDKYYDILIYLIEIDINAAIHIEDLLLWVVKQPRGFSDLDEMLSIIKYLYNLGVPIDKKSFEIAIKHEYYDIMKFFVDNIKCDESTLSLAISIGYLDMVKYLIEDKHLDIRWINWVLCMEPNNVYVDIIEYFIGRGLKLHSQDKLLYRAARTDNLTAVKYLIKYEFTDEFLERILFNSGKKVMKYLVERGINCHRTLEFAVSTGQLENVKFMINHLKRTMDEIEYKKRCEKMLLLAAWYYGCFSDRTGMVKYFIEEIKVDKHVDNNNVLYNCIRSGKIDILKYLVEEQNMDIHIDNEKPLKVAAQHNYFEIVEYLYEKGAQVNKNNKKAIRKIVNRGKITNEELLQYKSKNECTIL